MKQLHTYMIVPAIEINLSKNDCDLFSGDKAQSIIFGVVSPDIMSRMSAMSFGLSHYPCTSISCLDDTCI